MRSSLIVIAALCAAPSLPAQQLRTLSKPDAEFAEPFTSVNGIRELKDGRVIMTDVREKLIQLVDFKTGTLRKIGREGQGPKEYGLPMALVGLPGDTSAVYDPLNQRMLLITPNGEPGEFVRSAPEGGGVNLRPGGGGIGISITPPRYTDAKGRFYFTGSPISRGPDGNIVSADSQPILRFQRGAKQADTVAFIRIPKNNTTVSSSQGRQSIVSGASNPFAPRDEWVVTADGRVGVIRSPEYRLEWTEPARQVTGAIAYPKIKLTEKHKEQWREASRTGGNRLVMTVGPGGTRSGGTAPPNVTIPEPTDWPDVLPPFTSNAALVAPNGQIWINRTREANDQVPKYDVIDATGKVVMRVALPVRTRVIGFGNGVVYTIRTDEDDLQYLQRFKLQ